MQVVVHVYMRARTNINCKGYAYWPRQWKRICGCDVNFTDGNSRVRIHVLGRRRMCANRHAYPIKSFHADTPTTLLHPITLSP